MDEEEYIESTWSYLSFCVEPTLYEGLRFAKDLLIASVALRMAIQYIPMPHNVRHSLSFIIGGLLLYHSIGLAIIWIFGFTLSVYILILILSLSTRKRVRGPITCLCVISFLLLCELHLINPKMWQQIRGIQMIASMKIISVAIELDRSLFKKMINPVEFFGYIFCPANCMLGPWISFHSYDQYLGVKFLTKRWIRVIAENMAMALIFLNLSNCIVPWIISDDSTKWLLAYRDAQAFRMSHYFVSSMSMVSMLSAGFGLTNDCHSEIQITKPLFIELPRSLVQVVIFWNIPMHQWLKNYVFKSCHAYGQFFAILSTYVVSSLLHGCNFQLSAVLLSIGTFSYIEYNFRLKVASALEACCLANPCTKQCEHKYKKNCILTVFLNTLFSLITVIHLAYLGVMFEASFSIQETGYSFSHTISKWENLDFFNHGLATFFYVIYLMM
ncbi:protein-serine O-palmitoleoyltransferase porcupine [Pieris napi]|uniref:protein-serine O-palmitoleoyltransferase porcupine n=1 Tax=Pieris napi TaxID=78633 RepID=UPI001FBA177A|nr:protein-serine O-palmitoleoyltransferase porcupine [Pieris napi]